MSTMIPDVLTDRPRRVLRWGQVKRTFAEWRSRARSRDDLMGLSDRVLQDIGISRCMATFEASKPFWMV